MPFRNVLFHPKRVLIDSIDGNGSNDSLTLFSEESPITFEIGEEKVDNFLGEGRFARTYRVKSEGWLADNATSFCKVRMLPSPSPGIHDSSTPVPCFSNVKYAALKVYKDGITPVTLRQAEQGNWGSWQTVAQWAQPAVDEFRTLAFANGANGHTPRPYALGWVKDGNKLYPALLMEYLGDELLDKADGLGRDIKTAEELKDSLSTLIPRQRIRIAAEAAIELAQAVRNLHRTGIVHRDLSTGNIIFLCRGTGANVKVERAFLIDLGNSTKPRENQVSLVYSSRNVSDENPVPQASRQESPVKMTTLGYGAPEVLAWWRAWNSWSRRNDAKTDCFSVAAILYFLINGDPVPSFIRNELCGRYVIEWEERDLIHVYREEGYSLNLESSSSELADTLNRVVQECTVDNPELRRDLDWLLATLWDAVHPNITPQDPKHHSYSIISAYAPAYHEALCDINSFDPLAFLCDRERAINNWLQLHEEQQSPDTSTEDVAQGGSGATKPYAQSHGSIDDSFGPILNPSVAPVSVVTEDRIPLYIAPPRRKGGPGPEPPRARAWDNLLSDPEMTRISHEYELNAGSYRLPPRSFIFSNAITELQRQDYDTAAKTLRKCIDAYYPAAICYAWAKYTNRFGHVAHQNLVSDRTLVRTLADAARSGYTDALCTLGVYLSESTSDDDWARAAKLFELGYSVRQDSNCANNLGVLLYKGRGAKRDRVKALEYFEAAVDSGCEISLVNLAICHMQKMDMRQNFPTIADCLIKATELGIRDAYRYLWLACTSIEWEAELLSGHSIEGQDLCRKSLSNVLERHNIDVSKPIHADSLQPTFAFPRYQ